MHSGNRGSSRRHRHKLSGRCLNRRCRRVGPEFIFIVFISRQRAAHQAANRHCAEAIKRGAKIARGLSEKFSHFLVLLGSKDLLLTKDLGKKGLRIGLVDDLAPTRTTLNLTLRISTNTRMKGWVLIETYPGRRTGCRRRTFVNIGSS